MCSMPTLAVCSQRSDVSLGHTACAQQQHQAARTP